MLELRAACALMVAIVACEPGGSPSSAPSAQATGSAAIGAPASGSPVASGSGAALEPDAAAATLTFKDRGAAVGALTLAQITERVPAKTVEAHDPYYKRVKRWKAVPLADVVRAGLGGVGRPLEGEEFLLRAKDGYTVPLSGAQVFQPGGFIAFEDLDNPGWEPIGPQRANPAPFYVVWAEAGQESSETHPRPWQLSVIELAKFEDAFPHVVPTGVAEGAPAWEGLGLFRKHCILCHAINREGGRVGPDLNVPQSIVEYRPADQIRAYVKNPAKFRYGAMPAHEFLTERDLDALVAYFESMKERKHDPDAGKPAGH